MIGEKKGHFVTYAKCDIHTSVSVSFTESQTRSFVYTVLHYRGRVEQSSVYIDLPSLEYLPFGPLKKNFADLHSTVNLT